MKMRNRIKFVIVFLENRKNVLRNSGLIAADDLTKPQRKALKKLQKFSNHSEGKSKCVFFYNRAAD
jgi:hypothetical protein